MGIGRGIALELARQGAMVAIHYAHSTEGAQETLAEIQQREGKALLVQGDLGQVDDCQGVVDEVAKHFGGVDILVNNAGVTCTDDFLHISEATYNEVFNLNMRGYFFCTQRAVSYMVQRGCGSVVNVTSVHGHAGFPRHSAYAATKGAIIAFTRELA